MAISLSKGYVNSRGPRDNGFSIDRFELVGGVAMRAAVSRARFDADIVRLTAKSRACADGFAAALLLAGLGAAMAMQPGAALAQRSIPCAQVVDAAERLACYDRASPTAPPAAAVTPISPPSEPTRATPEAEAPVAPTATVPPPATAPPTTTQRRPPETLPIVVVAVRKLPGRSARFTTDNGEVWIQTGAEGVYVPKAPFDADLRPASMGTFFLRPRDHGWPVHVRRSH